MSYPAPTTGLGVAAKVSVQGNETSLSSVPGKNQVTISLSGANGFPEDFQLNPVLQDASGNIITPGTAFVLTAAATAASVSVLTLSAVAASTGGTAVYTGTITGGAANALVGRSYTVTGFVGANNNGTFVATASTATVLTLSNTAATAETHAGTATDTEKTTAYTGTITGGAANAFVGKSFDVAGFVTNAVNNGSFIATASSATVLTLANAAGVAETHAATATSEEVGNNVLTYYADGTRSYVGGTSPVPAGATGVKVVNVSTSGLLTVNGVTGGSVVEVSYPSFNNTAGTVTVGGVALPAEKIYADVAVNVVD